MNVRSRSWGNPDDLVKNIVKSAAITEPFRSRLVCPRCLGAETTYFGWRQSPLWLRAYVEWCPCCRRVVNFSPRGDLTDDDREPWPSGQLELWPRRPVAEAAAASYSGELT